MINVWLRLVQCRMFGHADPYEEPTGMEMTDGYGVVVTASYKRCARCGRRA